MSTRSSDVVIVGAGIAGTTLALALARAGMSVIVLDRKYVGGGSSSVNGGGIREQFSHEVNIRIARNTLHEIQGFLDTHGEDIGFRRAGYLMTSTAEEEERFSQAAKLQRKLGVTVEYVPAADIADLVPGFRADGISGANYTPANGYVDPRATVTAYGRAATQQGVEIVVGNVTAIESSASRVEAVVAGDTRFAANVVVNAAGAWAPALARLYGADLPITPMRSEIFVMDHAPVGGRITPMVCDASVPITFHTEGRGLLVSAGVTSTHPDAPETVHPELDRFTELKQRLRRRLPEFDSYHLAHAWAGLVEVTPDNNPIVGWTDFDNLFTVAGFSGHGMSIAPGLAPEAARLIRGERPRIPLEAFDPARFVNGSVLEIEGLWSGGAATVGGPSVA